MRYKQLCCNTENLFVDITLFKLRIRLHAVELAFSVSGLHVCALTLQHVEHVLGDTGSEAGFVQSMSVSLH